MNEIRVKSNFYLWLLTGRSDDFVDPSLNNHITYAGSPASDLVESVREVLNLSDTRTDFYVLAAIAGAYTVPAALRGLPDESMVVFDLPPSLPRHEHHVRFTPPTTGALPNITGDIAGRDGFTKVTFTREGDEVRIKTDGKGNSKLSTYTISDAGTRSIDAAYPGSDHLFLSTEEDPGDSGRLKVTPGDVVPTYVTGGTLCQSLTDVFTWDLNTVFDVSGAAELLVAWSWAGGYPTLSFGVTDPLDPNLLFSLTPAASDTAILIPIPAGWDGKLVVAPETSPNSTIVAGMSAQVTKTIPQKYLTIPHAADYGINAGFLVDAWEDGATFTVHTPPTGYDYDAVAERLRRNSAAVQLMAKAGVLDAFHESVSPVHKVGAAAVAVIRQRMSEISLEQLGFRVDVEREINSLIETSDVVPTKVDLFDTTDPCVTGAQFNA